MLNKDATPLLLELLVARGVCLDLSPVFKSYAFDELRELQFLFSIDLSSLNMLHFHLCL